MGWVHRTGAPTHHPSPTAAGVLTVTTSESFDGWPAVLGCLADGHDLSAAQARAALGQIDPLVPVAQVRTLQEVIGEATAPTAFALVLIGLAAAIATILGTVGVYAVVAYVVGGRTREIGVRMAMGARAGDVQRMVLRQGGTVILIGIAVGLAAAYLLTGLMSGLLYGVSPTDPVSYVAVTTLMLAVAGLALWIPSRRAARVDPLEALRSE